MPTPFATCRKSPSSRTGGATVNSQLSSISDWRCTRCNKLLGIYRDRRMHLRFARGHEYLVGFPAQAICRGCSTLNEATAPRR